MTFLKNFVNFNGSKDHFFSSKYPCVSSNIFENYLGAIVNTLVVPVFLKGVFSYSFTFWSIRRLIVNWLEISVEFVSEATKTAGYKKYIPS